MAYDDWFFKVFNCSATPTWTLAKCLGCGRRKVDFLTVSLLLLRCFFGLNFRFVTVLLFWFLRIWNLCYYSDLLRDLLQLQVIWLRVGWTGVLDSFFGSDTTLRQFQSSDYRDAAVVVTQRTVCNNDILMPYLTGKSHTKLHQFFRMSEDKHATRTKTANVTFCQNPLFL